MAVSVCPKLEGPRNIFRVAQTTKFQTSRRTTASVAKNVQGRQRKQGETQRERGGSGGTCEEQSHQSMIWWADVWVDVCLSSIRRPNNTSQQVVPGHQEDRGQTRGQRDLKEGDVLHLIATQIQGRFKIREIREIRSPFLAFRGPTEFQQLHEKYEISSSRCGKSRQTRDALESQSNSKWNSSSSSSKSFRLRSQATGIFNVF